MASPRDNELFQAVRIIDVFVLGPAMIKVGRTIGGITGTFLSVAGIATIAFNGINFFDIEKEKNA